MALQRLEAELHAAFLLGGIGARRAQDGSTARQDTGDAVERELGRVIFHHAAPAFKETDEFVVMMKDALANNRTNDCV